MVTPLRVLVRLPALYGRDACDRLGFEVTRQVGRQLVVELTFRQLHNLAGDAQLYASDHFKPTHGTWADAPHLYALRKSAQRAQPAIRRAIRLFPTAGRA